MRYKALIIDCDGTLVPVSETGMPSPRVIDAISRAKDLIHIGVATGRPYFEVERVLIAAGITSLSIVNGGSQIIDPLTKEVVWQKALLPTDVTDIVQIAGEQSLSDKLYFVSHDVYNFGVNSGTDGVYFQYQLEAVDETVADRFFNAICHIPTIGVHKSPSWVTGKFIIMGTHIEATKQHGVYEVSKYLNIPTTDMIGIGDSGNDFPLLMACGLKVAMGNAMGELKEIADYVAPSVYDDGVADVIEKFILNGVE